MSDRSEFRMNLAAIKRVDPYAKDIVDSSSHVAFYTFNSEDSEWEKTDVEGAFFIYSRNAEPLYSIFINNRLNTNSFVEPLTFQLELQSQPPFLLYRNERSRIRGFWFYNSTECDRIGELVGKLIKESEIKENAQEIREVKQMSMYNENIFTMLTRAQKDFNKTNCQVNISKNAAKPAAASEVPLFQRLLSNPVSVDQIEKQQRATTPQNSMNSPDNQDHISANTNRQTNSQNNDVGSQNFGKSTLQNRTGQGYTDHIQQSTISKPALMPPTMFLSTSTGKKSSNNENIQVEHSETIAATSQALKELEITLAKAEITAKPEPLTETQLLQAMLYLIKNDPEFIKKLHEAYLKSFNDMVS